MLLFAACVGEVVPKDDVVAKCYEQSRAKKFECLSDIATERGDEHICMYIIDPGFRTRCVKEVAVQQCDASRCETIQESWKRPSCTALVEEAKRSGSCR